MTSGTPKEKLPGQRRGLEIRAATGADEAGLRALAGACGLAWPWPGLADRIEAVRGGAGTVLVALDWGPPAGMVALHWFASLAAERPVAQINLLLVHPDERRRGIGRLLIKFASQAARVAGCGEIELVATEGQGGLRAFCLATGFAETGGRFARPLRKTAG